jgi:excisionase family DNA binding protein
MAKMITTVEAAKLTGYHRDYIRRLVSGGKVKGERLGRDWLVDQRSLLDYLKVSEQKGKKRGPKTKV